MSQNYELARLGDLCDSISGLWAGKKPPFEKAIVIRNTNFTKDCKLDLSNVAILDVETKKLQTRTLVPGDLIVEKSGGGPKQAVGRVVYFNETTGNYSLSNFTSALRIKNPSLVLPKYLQHFLYFQYVSGVTELMQSNSTGIRNLNIHQFLDIKVPLPNLSKQHLIVEKLDLAFREIDLIEKNLELSDQKATQLLGSILAASFTNSEIRSEPDDSSSDEGGAMRWREVSLKEICKVDWGNTKLTKSSYVNNGEFLAVSAAGADGLINHFEHEANVPVLSAIGAQCGRMFYPGARFTAIKNTITLTPKENIADGKFLFYLFTNVELPQRGTGQPFISKGDIEAFRVTIPESLQEQREIVEKLDNVYHEIDRIRNKNAVKKDFAGMLRQSLLSDSFSPNYGKEPA